MSDELINALITIVLRIIAEAERNGALTPEQAAARRRQLVEGLQQDHWKSKDIF